MSTKAAPETKATTRAPAAVAPARRLQRAGDGAASTHVPASVVPVLQSPGRPLDGGTRSDLESSFGHDFSAVRIHDGPGAAASAREVGARAYTVGQDIVWGGGEAAPEAPESRSLLAHELTHTVQQSGLQRATDGGVQGEHSPEYARLEGEAERAAAAVERGGHPGPIGRASAPMLSKGPPGKPASAAAPAEVEIDTDVSGLGPLKHKVKPDGAVPPPSAKAKVRKFRVDTFYMPGSKGEGADEIYKQYASAKQLRVVVGFNAENNPRTELWESRDRTEVLGDSWLQRVGWPVDEKDKRWKAITGESDGFPKVGGQTAQIDHIVELQLGGANNPSNLRPLDEKPNGESGRTIWQEVSALAKAVRSEASFKLETVDQIELGFDSVVTQGTVWPGSPQAKPWNALKVHFKALADRAPRVDDGSAKYIKLGAGANIDEFAVPANWGGGAKVADLSANPFNKAPAQMISSMTLTTVSWVNANLVTVGAELDLRNRTRIPLNTKAEAAAAGGLTMTMTGTLTNGVYKLGQPKTSKPLGFEYPFLSPVTIQTLTLTPQGDLDWSGKLRSKVGLIGTLDIAYAGGELKVTKGVEKETLLAKRVLGFSLNRADLTLVLAPDFKFEAGLGFQFGPKDKPYLTGDITIRPIEGGFQGIGTLDFKIPKIDNAKGKFTYTHKDGKDDWTVEFTINSGAVKLTNGYTVSGDLTAVIDKNSGSLQFSGQFGVTMPGGNSGKLGLSRTQAGEWLLSGEATLKPPKLDKAVTITASYVLSSGILEATVKTEQEFTIPGVNLKGKLKSLTIQITPEGKVVAWGGGGVTFERGRVKGSIDGELRRSGLFKGTGTIGVKLTDALSISATADYDEARKKEEQLKITGTLSIKGYKFLEERKDEKPLFSVGATIPVPGLSAGTSGLVINVKGSLTLAWKFGPGLMNLEATAQFNPLAADPDLSLVITGSASIGAAVSVIAAISAEGALQGDAIIAKAGVAAGLELTGTAALEGSASATLNASYAKEKFDSTMILAFSAGLFLRLKLDAYVRAYAESIIGWNKNEKWVWNLAAKDFPTGLDFSLSAPFKYSTAEGLKLPGIDDVSFDKPKIDSGKVLKDSWAGAGEPTAKQPT